MAQALDQEMYHYFIHLNDVEKKSVIQMLKAFVSSRTRDLQPVSLEEYNRELEQAVAEVEAGDFVPHEEVMKRHFKG